jgi:hypothetical protein
MVFAATLTPRSSRRFRTTLVCALLVLACSVVVVPSASADPNKSVGAALGFATVQFPAGQPFHITHGWLSAPRYTEAVGEYRVMLAVDGVYVRPDFVETTRQADDPVFGTELFRAFVFNFPDGMTGTHVFAVTFVGPCQALVDSGFFAGPCAHPNDLISTSNSPITSIVTFTP